MAKCQSTKNHEIEVKNPFLCSHRFSLTNPSQTIKPSMFLYCCLTLRSWLKLTQPYMHIRIFGSHFTTFLPTFSQNEGSKAWMINSSFYWWWQNYKILSICISTRSQYFVMPMKQQTSSAFSLLQLVWILPQSFSLPCYLFPDQFSSSIDALSLEEKFKEIDLSIVNSFFGFFTVNLVNDSESSLIAFETITFQTAVISSQESFWLQARSKLV